MLLDRRLSTLHKVIEDLMLIKGNDKKLQMKERKLLRVPWNHTNKQTDSELDHNNEPPEKVRVLDPSISDSHDNDSDDDSIMRTEF